MHADLTQIIQRSAHLLRVSFDLEGAVELAARSRGTPRIANRLLRQVRDFAEVNEFATVTREVALGALEWLVIDSGGFDKMDRAILAAIIDKFDAGPVGVETLAAAVGEESDTIGDVYEPYLLQEGFIARTARGRWRRSAPTPIWAVPAEEHCCMSFGYGAQLFSCEQTKNHVRPSHTDLRR
jgi:holliday junction DNA helicase RuvB